MIHVWKINEDLDLNKEDIERTFSGFSDALLLFAEGGRGKLICRTSLKKEMTKKSFWQWTSQNKEMKIISPRKKVEVSTRVTACSPWRHPARRKQPWILGQDLSFFVFNNDHDDSWLWQRRTLTMAKLKTTWTSSPMENTPNPELATTSTSTWQSTWILCPYFETCRLWLG